jgi:deazaflavin-dependent oxidoreductase (nitroreductase family)
MIEPNERRAPRLHHTKESILMASYIKPGFFTSRVFNPVVSFLAGRLGLSIKGARVLAVQGRKTGKWHSTPVNPLSFAGQRYLVAPRGETQWVRNIRVSRVGRLTVGGKVENVRVEEVPDHEKPPILRAYLQEWAWEVKQFFAGVGADAPEAELVRIAPQHPVFRVLSD